MIFPFKHLSKRYLDRGGHYGDRQKLGTRNPIRLTLANSPSNSGEGS